jgi:hypothetical protein
MSQATEPQALKNQNGSGLLGRLLGSGPAADAVRRPTALHLPVHVLTQLDVFKTTFVRHDANRVFS